MNVMDEILALYADRGDDAYFGECVSIAEHGLQAAHFVRAGHRGTQFRLFGCGRQLISGNRLRRQRRGLDACRQRGGAGGNSNGELQKIAAFHDISLFVRDK